MNVNPNTHLSLVIPAFNEQKIIKTTLSKVINYLNNKNYTWEIMVVDDGSRDNTVRIAQKFIKKGVKVFMLPKNLGKGAALREGVKNSSGKYVVYTDCDLSVSIENIDKFLRYLEKGSDLVIGSRRVVGSKITVHQPIIRELMGRVFTFLTRKILNTNLADFTCGFKGFEGDVARKLFAKGMINRWSYDSEILFLAHKFGHKIFEMPVEWFDRKDSRVNLKRVVLESFWDLIRIRANFARGMYA